MADHLAVPLPPDVARAVSDRWPDRAEQWHLDIGSELRHLCHRYGAVPLAVIPARYAFVVSTSTRHGPLIMRASPDPDGPSQAKVAQSLAEIGVAPRVHEIMTSPTGTWLVMDQISPGKPLADLDFNAAYPAVRATLSTLRNGAPELPETPSLVDWLRARLVGGGNRDMAPGEEQASEQQRAAAVATLSSLERDTSSVLCHGDASPWNFLVDHEERLWLIDPRGVHGEIAYDVAVVALKASVSAPPVATVRHLAADIGVSVDRAEAWMEVAAAARV
ncbi:MAG TPA: phosphotransferase [Streptosporangiaceae bacterium]|jgi:streptomycin 6-kinase